MTKFYTTFVFFIVFQLFLLSSLTRSAITSNVTATVTPKLISVSVSPTSVDYGTMVLNGSANPTGNPTIVVTNNGNVNENFSIRGANATPASGSGSWTLASSAGVDQYVHSYGVGPGYTYTALTTSYAEFVGSVAPAGTSNLRLRIALPTATSNYVTYTTTVTVQASE